MVEYGLDMPSSIYDSIRAIQRVSVVSSFVKTWSTHFQGAVSLRKWAFVNFFNHKQSSLNGYLSICLEISKACGIGLAMPGGLVMCTFYTTKFIFGQLKLRLDLCLYSGLRYVAICSIYTSCDFECYIGYKICLLFFVHSCADVWSTKIGNHIFCLHRSLILHV